jgi:transcriptional regulator with XRE-family HTH domain
MTTALTQAPATSVATEGVICGAILRECRRVLDLHQEAIAEKLMVNLNTYRAWEDGRRPVTRLPLHRYKALVRSLADIGAPEVYLDLLDLAVEVDIAVGRALISDDNPFPPAGRCERWYALLAWVLLGTQPVPASVVGLAKPPRLSHSDRTRLMNKIRHAVFEPTGELDAETLHTLKGVYLNCPPCPPWCDRTCEPFGPVSEGVLHQFATTIPALAARLGEPDGSVRVAAWSFTDHGGVAETGIELDVQESRTLGQQGRANFSAGQARALADALNELASLIEMESAR